MLSAHSQIADFGMSRSLGDDSIYYMAEKAKFPIRWTAPEVGKLQILSSFLTCLLVLFASNMAQVHSCTACVYDQAQFALCIQCSCMYVRTYVQALIDSKFSSSSDVWSFGILMYEIWSLGGKPFPNLKNLDVSNLVPLP